MKICFVNSILYTPENGIIPKRDSIEDTMAYKLCLEFYNSGHEITLIAAQEYKPSTNIDSIPFKAIFLKSNLSLVFKPSLLPLHISLYNVLKAGKFDLIISSEFFSINSLIASVLFREKCFIWQELSSHNSLFLRLPSLVWYNIVGKLIKSKVVARSEIANDFISNYSTNVLPTIIEHGVAISEIEDSIAKKDQFIVVSQLIKRKNIAAIIYKFASFLNINPRYELIIIGDGELKMDLISLTNELGIADSVKFLGFVGHKDLLPIWRESKALLVDTLKDLNMVSVPESIACGTPVIMNEVPLSKHYISKNKLGIVKDGWGIEEMQLIVDNNSEYVINCLDYRKYLSVSHVVDQFITLYEDNINQ
ncbi:MAG: glycosyltransferase [Bacteroidales bacterium]